MDTELTQPPLEIEERRLIKTWLSRKPAPNSFLVTAATVFAMALLSVIFWRNLGGLSDFLPAVPSAVFSHGQWWRIFTAIFIHADLEHFLSNMYMLTIFSFFIYGYFGFGMFPALSFLVAAAVNIAAIWTYAPNVQLLGASGLVYVLGGLWLTLYFFIQRQYTVFNRLLRVVGIGLAIFFPTTFVPTTSYRTHAIGFVAGVALGAIYFFYNRRTIQAAEVYKTIYAEPE